MKQCLVLNQVKLHMLYKGGCNSYISSEVMFLSHQELQILTETQERLQIWLVTVFKVHVSTYIHLILLVLFLF